MVIFKRNDIFRNPIGWTPKDDHKKIKGLAETNMKTKVCFLVSIKSFNFFTQTSGKSLLI